MAHIGFNGIVGNQVEHLGYLNIRELSNTDWE